MNRRRHNLKELRVFSNGENLNCGGKRSATTLRHGREIIGQSQVSARSKALSPLRSANAVQKLSRGENA